MTTDNKTVLVVEDNALNMKLFEQILLQGGYQPVCSLDGLNLVDLIAVKKPSCILMDIQLPQVSGFDLIREIRAHEAVRNTPVVAVTAFAGASERERFLGAGFNAFLPKPISVRILLSTVNQLAI
ncbi:CheY-like receiver protein [Caenispirillum salinarum AK4]|uniref:CheY-like receiver protein n=1 Tax=Caenispirillum salinarum AK4 TaxID=1238182 RepID=K9HRK3_9PROT|nr:response regulator [Caenispirillum salinarum]EKV32928.1 CheY-like receiver protein [Caenispirillum salinarum AK4]